MKNNFRLREVETKYGVIYSRDAMILNDFSLSLTPMKFDIAVSLALSGCRPSIDDDSEVNLLFRFSKVRTLGIYMLDDYQEEKYLHSGFDEYVDESGQSINRYVLSTYDHVFDVCGEYELIDA